MKNSFEFLCELASKEKWCWKLSCTTCGCIHFRYSLSELTNGKSPEALGWIVHAKRTRYSNQLGPLPRCYSDERNEKIHQICSEANLVSISSTCKFPDWLGYLGLVLEFTYSDIKSYHALSTTWALQLDKLASTEPFSCNSLHEVVEGNRILSIHDLDNCERDIINNQYHH